MKTDNDVQGAATGSKGSAPVWICVGLLFSLMAIAWTAMFFFASKHRAVDVPLTTRTSAKAEAR